MSKLSEETQTTVYEHTGEPSGLSEEAYEKACKDFAENEKQFIDLTVYLEGCKKNLEFLTRQRKALDKEVEVQAKAMNAFIDQRKECRTRKEELLKTLGLVPKNTVSGIKAVR